MTNPLLLDNTSPVARRAWHVVALSTEVAARPVQVWLLGEPWVLVRPDGPDGEVRAFPDRCPHRLAPLSAGRVVDGTLQCGYHGWRFASDGTCVEMPALGKTDKISKRATLAAPAGIAERYGLVWLAPEEPFSPLPEFPEGEDGAFRTALCEVVSTPASAAQLVDNFMDASHFPFVHAETFGAGESAEVVEPGIATGRWDVSTTFQTWYRTMDDTEAIAGRRPDVQRQDLFKQGFASYNVYLRLGFPDLGWTFGILFCCRPESETATRVYKLVARLDDLPPDDARMAAWVKDEDLITQEDLGILERYPHRHIHLDRQAELHTRADRLSLAWRGVMARAVAVYAGTEAAAQAKRTDAAAAASGADVLP